VTGNNRCLDDFYEALKAGLTVEDFLQHHHAIFELVHSAGLTHDYRLARKPVKKLRDEITPAAYFCSSHAAPRDLIRFNLDSNYPDCTLARQGGEIVGIEVTVAQARERRALMTELNEKGEGRGFIGATDDKPEDHFRQLMKHEPQAYSTEEAISCTKRALRLRADGKRNHSGEILLIDAPLEILPAQRWIEFVPEFSEIVQELKFKEVYLTGRGDNDNCCLKIK
jgi:hypothetical protein